MDLFDLFIRIGVDDTGVSRQLDEVNRQLNSTEESAKGASSSFEAFGNVLGVVGKAVTAAVGAAAAGATALVKESVNAYSQYEQLVGGVETLFSNLEGTLSAAPTVIENASNAFKTANMSANQYMETVTSFSAALISSLEGDYEKAAQVADMALVDMADNANKMGTAMESIQNAYQGFAKQNYTMLDNLKLGYGGTKSEMERLLADAQKFSGIKYDISNLSDVYEAIHIIQEQFGIAGATAEEASTTIEGSLKTLSAAWQNLITGFADKDADLGKLMNDVVESAEIALGNLQPVVENAIESLVNAVDTLAPTLIERLPELIDQLLPPLINATNTIVETLVKVLPETLGAIVNIVPDTINDVIKVIAQMLPDIVQAGVDMVTSLIDGMSETLPELIPIVVEAILNVADTVVDNLDTIIDAGIKLILALVDGITDSIPKLIEKAPEIIIKLATALVENIYKIDEVPPKIIKEIADGLVHTDWTETAEAMMDGLISSLDVAQKKVKFWIDGARKALTGESLYDGDFNNVTSSDFIDTMKTGKDIVVDAIGEAADAVEKSYDAFYGTVNDGNDKVADAAGQMPDAYSKITGEMSDYAKSLEAQAKQWKSSVSKATDEVVEDEKTLKAKLQAAFRDFESEMYENGFTQEWLVHKEREYVEALDHSTELYKDYNNKLLKEEEKLTKAADKEYEKQLTESNKRKKTALEKAFANFEKIALEQGFTEEWLVNQERTYLEALDHNTELYEEYNMKLLRAENKLSTETENQRKKDAEQTKKSFTSMVDNMVNSAKDKIKEYEKVVEDIKSKIKTFADKLTTSYKDMFEFTVDEKTGKMSAKKTQDFLTDRVHQLEAYYDNIQKLKEKGISDSMLKQLSGMSAEEGAAVAEYWMKLDDKELGKLDRVWSRYEKTGQKVSEELYSEELENAEQKLDSERNTLLGEIQKTVDDKLNEVVGAIATTSSTGQQIFNDLNDLLTDLNDKIENTFGQGFAVTLDSKQVVGAILPQVDNGLGRRTRAAMRGGA